MKKTAIFPILLSAVMATGMPGSIWAEENATANEETVDLTASVAVSDAQTIESVLNLANNDTVTWTYNSSSDAWVMSIVTAVAYPELEDYQGVSVAVPGAYVTGIDTDGDGVADVTSDTASDAAMGMLVIDYDAQITSENGQVYTAGTAPVIINTGAAGYSDQANQKASASNCVNGYINVSCGNRGKQSTAVDENGNTYYTGDAPDCLVDQKDAIRFVKYNILLGNLPGNVDLFVSTGGSGGGAHATMVAATSNNPDFYPYEAELGAVGVYELSDGTYSTTVTIDGVDYEISDGVWGTVAYSAITALAEGDITMALEYYLDTDYSFNTDFQKALAGYLSEEYMNYINVQNLTIDESAVGFDLNADGDLDDNVALTIEYDEENYADTNGYGGTYLDLYLAEFISNLQWYVDNLSYAEGWTWFDEDGNALSDDEVALMTAYDKALAFIEGRTAGGSTGGSAGAPGGGAMPGGDMPGGDSQDGESDGETASLPDGESEEGESDGEAADDTVTSGMGDEVGTPDQGTTQSASSHTDSANYDTYEELLTSYAEDITAVEAGDRFGNNQVELYNPFNYIGAEDTEDPAWVRIVMGAAEGDMSMFASLNLEIAWLNAGTDATIEWQWNGGHVPSEIFGESLSLTIDEMYGQYVDGAIAVAKSDAAKQTENGTAEEPTGEDISGWVALSEDGTVSFSLSDAASYRTDNAAKAIPGFDVIDYAQETYEFGSREVDARHFDKYVLQALTEHEEELETLFNK